MSEVNFVVDNEALAIVQNTQIKANFDECREALADMIAPYTYMIVTEDGIADAKNDRAKIRKLATRIDDTRKAVKKAYSEPLARFEADCKELVAICEEGSNNLDRQIKDFEARDAQAKVAALLQVYNDHADDEIRSYRPWESIFNPKWANKGYALEQAEQEIITAVDNTARDLETIRGMGDDDLMTAHLLDTYRQTRDIGAVVRKASEIVTMRKREEERRLAAEAARKEAEERRRAAEEADLHQAVVAAAAESVAAITGGTEGAPADEKEVPRKGAKLMTVDFRVTCTADQLAELGSYMVSHGIKYGRVPDR